MASSRCASGRLASWFPNLSTTCSVSKLKPRGRRPLAPLRRQPTADRLLGVGACNVTEVLDKSKGQECKIRAQCGKNLRKGSISRKDLVTTSLDNLHSTSCQNITSNAQRQSNPHNQLFRQVAPFLIPLAFLVFNSSSFALDRPQNKTMNTIVVPPGGGHMSLGQRIAVALRSLGLPDWVTILFVAALPVVELRGAIPVGYWLGFKPIHTYALAVLGNMLPIPFVIAYIGRVSDWLIERSSLAKKFFGWLFARTRSRADLMVKYRTLGLTLFVAVPLPLTGAWSGAIGAHLLGLPFLESIAANLVGVMIAGVIVTVLCELGWTGAVIAGVGLFAAAIATFWTSQRKKRAGEEPLV